jgi:hypothetical protein
MAPPNAFSGAPFELRDACSSSSIAAVIPACLFASDATE